MKKHMSRNTILMVVLDLVLGIVLSLYIANTGTVPAADNAATYTDGTYTASAKGCLSDVAVTVTITGGKVTGVEPQFFVDSELQHDGLTELIVTKDMTDRKTKMIELGDAFIAFPGGTGTLEEIAEVMSKVSLKHLDAPCILYNLNGYYDGLKALLGHMIEMGLSTKERQEGIYFADTLDEIERILAEK